MKRTRLDPALVARLNNLALAAGVTADMLLEFLVKHCEGVFGQAISERLQALKQDIANTPKQRAKKVKP